MSPHNSPDIILTHIEGPGGISAVDIAQRHDVFFLTRTQVAAAHATDADAGDIEFVARSVCPQHMTGHIMKR
jgi:hypothetical protein